MSDRREYKRGSYGFMKKESDSSLRQEQQQQQIRGASCSGVSGRSTHQLALGRTSYRARQPQSFEALSKPSQRIATPGPRAVLKIFPACSSCHRACVSQDTHFSVGKIVCSSKTILFKDRSLWCSGTRSNTLC